VSILSLLLLNLGITIAVSIFLLGFIFKKNLFELLYRPLKKPPPPIIPKSDTLILPESDMVSLDDTYNIYSTLGLCKAIINKDPTIDKNSLQSSLEQNIEKPFFLFLLGADKHHLSFYKQRIQESTDIYECFSTNSI